MTSPKVETQEIELDTDQCAEVALYMYEEWKKAMQPPLFIYKTFPEWLKQLKDNHPTPGDRKRNE